jgi:hypothetical protein
MQKVTNTSHAKPSFSFAVPNQNLIRPSPIKIHSSQISDIFRGRFLDKPLQTGKIGWRLRQAIRTILRKLNFSRNAPFSAGRKYWIPCVLHTRERRLLYFYLPTYMRDLLGFTFRLLVLTSAKVRGSHVGALSTRRMAQSHRR